jgi:hypothetical protein
MWPNFQAAVARCLLASGVVETRDDVRLHTDAVPDLALT